MRRSRSSRLSLAVTCRSESRTGSYRSAFSEAGDQRGKLSSARREELAEQARALRLTDARDHLGAVGEGRLRAGGGADREDLGVGGGVAAQLALVAGQGERLAFAEDRGADRDVAVGLGEACLLERKTHRLHVLGHWFALAHRSGSMSPYNFTGRP